jgi:hypothetical protein
VASSILALYLLLGRPSATHRDPVSWEKFEAKVTHRRKAKGYIVDTRAMEVSLPDYKRDQVVELLATWTVRGTYTILEAAELASERYFLTLEIQLIWISTSQTELSLNSSR